MTPDLVVIHEHPEWQKPLFAALEHRGLSFTAYDLKRNAFDPACLPRARLYFNQASPSAASPFRGNTRAVPLALSLMRSLEAGGARVLNGSRAFSLELSKSVQVGPDGPSLTSDHPRTITFNLIPRLRCLEQWQAGGMAGTAETRTGRQRRAHVSPPFARRVPVLAAYDLPELWLPPATCFCYRSMCRPIRARGIVRMEFLGGRTSLRHACGIPWRL